MSATFGAALAMGVAVGFAFCVGMAIGSWFAVVVIRKVMKGVVA